MNNDSIDVLLENQSLKFEFSRLNLDLSFVFYTTPDNLERENRCLRNLLDWVQKYNQYGDRKIMELMGYHLPPIDPDISPNDDWYRFERWVQGIPLRQKLKNQLPPYDLYKPKAPDHLTDEEIIIELQKLTNYLVDIRVTVEFQENIPPRLVYHHLLDCLEEEFDTIGEGFWHLDGCTGYCPGCFQRPWCEIGSQSCWLEDEEAGTMHLIDSVKEYVSASPVSLTILQKFQAQEDKEWEEFEKKHKAGNISIDLSSLDIDDDDYVPF